ncbi:hypothetical protein GCM10023238_08570 [Streptomyces heliomycini]
MAREVLRAAGATSPFPGHRPSFAPTPFPAVICASVNDAIVHGVPDGYRLRDGDLVSIDCGAQLGGWAGDSAISFTVGAPRPADVTPVGTAERALAAGIEAAVVGNRIGDIAYAIGTVCRAGGTASWRTSAATASDAVCTRTRACRTRAGRDGDAAAARHGVRDRAHADRGRHRHVPHRPGRPAPAHRRRHPRGPRGTHGGRHGRGPPPPHGPPATAPRHRGTPVPTDSRAPRSRGRVVPPPAP